MKATWKNRYIAIIDASPTISTNPCIVAIIENLHKHGCDIDVFKPFSRRFPDLKYVSKQRPFPVPFHFWDGNLRRTLRNWQATALNSRFLSRRKNGYDLIFGVNSRGLIAAREFITDQNTPIVYLNFEIFFRDELISKADIEEKDRECHVSREAALILVQDKNRAELLAKENGLTTERFYFMPVAPSGKIIEKNGQEVRQHIGLSNNEMLVIHSGSFAEWTYASDLLESLNAWPDGIHLLIHTRQRPWRHDPYYQALVNEKHSNLAVSTVPLESQQYERIVASADIGLVLYKPSPPSKFTQKNIEHIGLSSGKFAYYMKYGLPVISVRQATYETLLRKYNFGVNLQSFDEIGDALYRIRNDYEHYSAEAKRLFRELLDFDLYWPELERKLLELLQ